MNCFEWENFVRVHWNLSHGGIHFLLLSKRSSRQIPDFHQLSGISVVFFNILQKPNILPFWYFLCNFMKILFCGINTTEWNTTFCGINTTEIFFVKIHEKYQKGNIFDFYKMQKNTTEIPDNWRKSGICREDLRVNL